MNYLLNKMPYKFLLHNNNIIIPLDSKSIIIRNKHTNKDKDINKYLININSANSTADSNKDNTIATVEEKDVNNLTVGIKETK